MDSKKYYGIQESIDLQFFCEDLFNGTYVNTREQFISDLMNLIHSYADGVAKVVAEEVRKETFLSVENCVKDAFDKIQEENVLSKLEKIMMEDEEVENDEEGIFELDK